MSAVDTAKAQTTIANRPVHPWVAANSNGLRFGALSFEPREDWDSYIEQARRAEALGFDSFWVQDHPLSFADCWMTLSALAVKTTTIRLESLVSCVQYRPTAMLARQAADVDRLSKGRLILGLGAGDDEHEAKLLNLPFAGARERHQAVERGIQHIRHLWETAPISYEGDYFAATEGGLSAGCVQQPYVPLLIGGGGEQVTLRQIAQYADMTNILAHSWAGNAFTPEDVRRKYVILRGHCEAVGRSYDSILRSYLTIPLVLAETPATLQAKLDAMPQTIREIFRTSMIACTPRELVPRYRALVEAGVQYFIVALWRQDVDTMELFAKQVMPDLSSQE